jgi:hypothetical protein
VLRGCHRSRFCLTLEQRPQFVRRHTDDGLDVAHGGLGHIPTCVDWDGDCASIGMLRHVVLASYSLDTDIFRERPVDFWIKLPLSPEELRSRGPWRNGSATPTTQRKALLNSTQRADFYKSMNAGKDWRWHVVVCIIVSMS